MADFTVQVTNFEKHGAFDYRFDEAGNVVLNPSSSAFQQHYLSIPLSNINYNNNKIKSFYDVEFTEFVAPATASANALSPAEIADQINSLTAQNQELQDRLDRRPHVVLIPRLPDPARRPLSVFAGGPADRGN